MTKKKNIPDKYQIWIDVRKRYRLSDVHIQMARELGMNPKKFGKIANEKQEPWKAPLPAFIEHIYLKRFGRDKPADVKSIEEIIRANEKKKEERRRKKELQKEADPSDQRTNSFALEKACPDRQHKEKPDAMISPKITCCLTRGG